MKATELRILNFVNYPNWYNNETDVEFMVRELYYDDDKIGLTNGLIVTQTYLEYIKAIPLTNEWLLKFGFEKHNHVIDGVIYINKGLRISETFMTSFRGGFIGRIKHVHQLQNLYFALCNEELTIK